MGGFEFWHWLGIAAALGVIEMFTLSGFFLWLLASALVIGGLLYLMPAMGWQVQLLLFAGISAVSLVITRLWIKPQPQAGVLINRRAEQYLGQVVTLDGPLISGRGRVLIGDSLWKIEGSFDMPAGSKVRVAGVNGIVLRVEPCLQLGKEN